MDTSCRWRRSRWSCALLFFLLGLTATAAWPAGSANCTLSLSGIHGTVAVNGVEHALPWSDRLRSGTSVTLDAIPAAGYHFAGWTGGLSGTTDPISFVLSSDTSVEAGFEPNTYTLSLWGTEGSVRVDGVEHVLPWSGAFAYGTAVALEAVPTPGHHFVEWSGSLSGADNPTSLVMSGNASATATFAPNTYSLFLSGTNGQVRVDGVAHALPYSETFTYGDTVALEAVPAAGYAFTEWTGDLSGSTNPVTLTVDGEKHVQAEFAAASCVLELVGEHGQVAVNGVAHSLPWSGEFGYAESVTLTAVPDTGYFFANWSGNLSSTTNPVTITMASARYISAEFVISSCTLSLAGDHGTVTVNGLSHALPWVQTFDYGSTVTLSAEPEAGYVFAGWAGDVTATGSPTTITMEGDRSVTAQFEPNPCTLTITGNHGSVSLGGVSHSLPYSEQFPYGASVTVTAEPDHGYYFAGWTGDVVRAANPLTIAVNGDRDIVAGFVAGAYELVVTGSNGMVDVDGVAHSLPWSGFYPYGAVVALTAVPDSGYSFAGWSGDASGMGPAAVLVDADKAVVATFSANTYTLTVVGSHGTVSVDGVPRDLPWSGTYGYGMAVTLDAVPDEGYHFAGWSGDLAGTVSPSVMVIGGDESVTAEFAINTYTLSLTGTHGTVSVNGVSRSLPYSGSFSHGDVVTLSAVPDTGYHFVGWSGGLTGSENPASVTVLGDLSIAASFTVDSYSLSLVGSNATVSVNGLSQTLPWSGTFDWGTAVTLQATPSTGYHFVQWSGGVSGTGNPITFTMDAPKSVTVECARNTYALSLVGTHGSVEVNGTAQTLPWSGTFEHGATVALLAVPDTSYLFVAWSGDVTGGTNPISVVTDRAKTVTATFEKGHALTVAAAASPTTVTSGGSATLSATATDTKDHALTWSWSDGGAGGTFAPSAAVQNPTYTAAANLTGADRTVTLTVTVTCDGPSPLSQSDSVTLTVQPLPHEFSISATAAETVVVSGGSTALAASAEDSYPDHGVTWVWSDGGAGGSFAPTATEADPTYTAPANTTDSDLTVSLTVTGTCSGPPAASDSEALTLTVQPVEHALVVTASAAPTTVGTGGSTALMATARDSRTGHTVTWAWSDGGAGGSFAPSAAQADPTYTAPANFSGVSLSVTLSVTGTCSGMPALSDTASVELTVTSGEHAVTVTVSPPVPATVASSGTAALRASASDPAGHGVAVWEWSDGGAGGSFSPSAAVARPTYTAPENLTTEPFSVTLTARATCDGPAPATGSGTATLTVDPYVGTAELTAASFPTILTWGQTGQVSLTFENHDPFAWEPADGYHLVPEDDVDRWGVLSLPLLASVAPEASTAFTIDIVAPPVTTLRYDTAVSPPLPTTGTLNCGWELRHGSLPLTGGYAHAIIDVSHFPDCQPGTDGGWARYQIEECTGRVPAIVGGYPDGTYAPRLPVTRDQMAVYLQRALDLPLEPFDAHFPDVTESDTWCNRQVEALWRAGLVTGYPDGHYWPAIEVSRAQMAAYIARGMLLGESVPAGPSTPSFPDVAPDGWGGYDAVEYLKTRGVVGGYPDGKYWPDQVVTRDQMAVYVYRGFIQHAGSAVVLAGPAVTASQAPLTALAGSECGWTSTSSGPSSAPGAAYLALDAMQLRPEMGERYITFELRAAAQPERSAAGAYLEARGLSAIDLAAARATAMAHGTPHWTIAWPLPAGLAPGDYVLVVSVENARGELQEVARREPFTITP